ncbi:hypothetical protein HS088_TW11G00773 [Tripterygium wilfordii]|uniref:Uncharacterized protein n=1 Tax=Tripterygium wilfordii TaxID=458696 RepID=A0A7J7D3Q1_TRIWF|nr:uncharacterized protein LOC120009572 [Tripterygium wilfordii]XP_038716143.1 uncharacterized protein LOC120009572 [Tripterygium wilfordii]KAF5740696.1 hypothetical protein HS088_TW11G00773 [Tripterygium wilfordii]
MGVFYHEEPPNPSRRCKFLRETLKDAFSNCSTFAGRLSTSNPEEEEEDCPTSDFNDDEEVVLSVIRSRAMKKVKSKHYFATDSFNWVFSPKTGELFITPKTLQQSEDTDKNDEKEEFFSVGSCISCCSSSVGKEAFLSARSNFSRCSSFKGFDIPDHRIRRHSILQEFCHCEGWPFGLCRKAVLLPPLPKSPAESWSWRKGTRVVKMHYV